MRTVRVLYVIDSLHGGGAETSLVEMLPALKQRGVDMRLVTLLDDDNALASRVRDLSVEVQRLASRSWPGRLAQLRRELRQEPPDVLHNTLTSLTEALARELPFVATDIAAIREVVGDVGWPLVPVDDAVASPTGLEGVPLGQLPLVKMALRGRRPFESVFKLSQAVDGMVDIDRHAVAEVQG